MRWTTTLLLASSNSSRAITFTFGPIPLGKGMNPFIYPPSDRLKTITTVLRQR